MVSLDYAQTNGLLFRMISVDGRSDARPSIRRGMVSELLLTVNPGSPLPPPPHGVVKSHRGAVGIDRKGSSAIVPNSLD